MTTQSKKEKPTWVKLVTPYQSPNMASIVQIINSFVPFFLVMGLSIWLVGEIPYIVTILLGLLAAGFLMRIFIIQHDCGHGSFFKSKRANAIVGTIAGIITLTPYDFWRRSHAIHHAHNGDLAHRGTGDVYTMTFREYREASRSRRLWYRVYRHPFMMFIVGPSLMFILLHRSPFALKHARSAEGRRSIIQTDIILIILLVIIALTIGLSNFLLAYFPMMFFAASVGVWMFYIQHQFEEAYWSQAPDWDYADSALKGSSYYKLPKILQWFSGNIGLHHIHHLSPRIPNYKLQSCHDENPEFQDVVTLTLKDSLKVVISGITLWDQDQQKMISFREAHRIEQEMKQKQAKQLSPAEA